MNKETIKRIILEALGEASVEFMSQGDTRAGDIIMPTRELTAIADRATEEMLDTESLDTKD